LKGVLYAVERLDFEKDVAIDESALDVEWLRQADLMHRYSVYAAKTHRYMDEMKERLDVVKAKLDLDIRSNPDKYGLSKVTESVVQSTILLQDEYQEMSKKYRDARYEYEIALAATRALDQKKTALENLVRLLGMDYFAGPSAPRDIGDEWARHAKEMAQKEQNKRVRIRKRLSADAEQEGVVNV